MFGQATTSRLTDRQASGFGEGLGTARTSPIPFPRASGSGSGLGTAQTQEKRLKTASGFGESSGQAIPLTLFEMEQVMCGHSQALNHSLMQRLIEIVGLCPRFLLCLHFAFVGFGQSAHY